tara:strand:+ start:1738 stop:2892 length:1155 start_codon:yes stop_codon:yes gene_type:complete
MSKGSTKSTNLNNINEDVNNSNIPDLDTTGFFCSQPFTNLEVDTRGEVRTCCAYWMNQSLGNITVYDIEEVLNSKVAQDIRSSILDGSFSYCNKKTCPRIQSLQHGGDGILQKIEDVKDPTMLDIIQNKKTTIDSIKYVNFLWDLSCNLRCPSCRVQTILNTKGESYENNLRIQNKILDYVLPPDEDVVFNITGSGDPFASKVFRDFLVNFDGQKHSNVVINLQTNGVMFNEKMWDRMSKCHENIHTVLVSIDAATEQTYDKIRVGGNWDILMKNIEMLDELKRCGEIERLRLDFVVQRQNYKEMPQAIDLANSLFGVDGMYFSIITDWGTWPRDEYKWHAVWMEDNEEHSDFLRVLDNDIFEDKKVELGNVHHYYKTARNTDD